MIRLRRYTRWAFFPALAWLIMQGVMSFAVVALLSSSSIGAQGELPFTELVICSPSGPKRVAAADIFGSDADGTGEGWPTDSDAAVGCQWCQAYGSLAVPARTAQATDCVFATTTVVFHADATPVDLSKAASTGFRSRAPPA